MDVGQEFPVADRIFSLTAGGPGFVVAGFNEDDAAVWTSTDGRAWQSVSDPSLDKATISQLITTDSGLIGFGWRSDNEAPGIWTSADGAEWLAATNETGMTVAKGLEAVGSDGGRAVAFVSEGDKKPPAIWETTGRAEWTRTGALQDVAAIDRVAGGTRGWVALGDNKAWTSADGQTWSKGVPGPDVDQDVDRRRCRVRGRRLRGLAARRDLRRPAAVRRSYVDLRGWQGLGADAGDEGVRVGDGDEPADRRSNTPRVWPAA